MIVILIFSTSLYLKPIRAESSDPVQILNVQVQPSIIKINDTFSLNMIILNSSPFPIYLTSGSCIPAFSVVFDAHVKQIYPNIACTAEAILQKVDPQSEVTISNTNKPGVIYQAVQPGMAAVNITLLYYTKNQTATDYSDIYYNTSKSFLFTIYGNDTNSSEITPAELNKKLEAAREKISNIMMNNTTDIPFNMVGINIINSTLDVGIDSAKATLSAEQYKEKIREIIGNIPITLTFGHIQLLGNSTSEQKDPSTSFVMSPLKQFKSGIAVNDVKCGQGFQLIIRSEGGFPACVKYSSVQKLVDWGLILTNLSVDGLKETYSIGEKINATISFQGIMHYCDYPQIQVLDSNQNVVLKSKEKDSMCVSNPFIPLPYVTERLDLDSAYGGLIMINDTGSYTLKISLSGNDIEKGFTVK